MVVRNPESIVGGGNITDEIKLGNEERGHALFRKLRFRRKRQAAAQTADGIRTLMTGDDVPPDAQRVLLCMPFAEALCEPAGNQRRIYVQCFCKLYIGNIQKLHQLPQPFGGDVGHVSVPFLLRFFSLLYRKPGDFEGLCVDYH